MRKNKHRRFIPAVEYLREPILLEAERATKLPLRLALFHLTSQADRNGVVPLNYEDIEARAPGDDLDWERVIDLLGAAGFLTIFGAGDGLAADNSLPGYIQLSGWHRMQSPHDKEKTDLPAPPDLNRYLTPQKLDWKPWQRAAGVNFADATIPAPPEVLIADQLVTAAAGNVSTSAVDITPILDLIEDGIPLESILQSVRDWVADDLTKLNSWGEEWLLSSIKTDWELRPAAQQHPDDASAKAPESREGRSGASTPASHSTGFFANLTPEQQKAALAYRGPENIGPEPGLAHPPPRPCEECEDFPAHTPNCTACDGVGHYCPHSFRNRRHCIDCARAPTTSQPPSQPPANPPTNPVDVPPKDTAEMGGAPSGAENSLPHGAENSLPLSPAGVPWDELLAGYVAGNVAWDAGWGPRPGSPGCKVPVEMLREYGCE